LPDLIIGHGALGRLVARIACAYGAQPVVWEVNPDRRDARGLYEVSDPATSQGKRFNTIVDASGYGAGLDRWLAALAPRGEIILAGFYTQPLAFNFVPAFLREARMRVAAQWQPQDLEAVRQMVGDGVLSLADIVNRRKSVDAAGDAYRQAFEDPTCLKMVLDWRRD
jgi:3-hydroxyethyl bacteriochlorophyllide a dehydrogenase